MFQDRIVQDPRTGKERVVTAEEQELMLENGILLDIPFESSEQQDKELAS